MSITRGAALLAVFSIGAGLLGGCDSAPGVLEDHGTPPVVSSLQYSPTTVVFEQIPDDNVIGDSVIVVEFLISADVSDADGDLETVSYLVNDPFDPFDPLATGELNRIGNSSRYEGTALLEIPRGNSGLYTVIVSAVDAEVRVSNQVRGLFEYVLEGGEPPVITTVTGPDEITPPTTFAYVATVTDPDGLGNIASVVTRAPNDDTFNMFDDGEQGGDEIAGDGRFTVTFDAPEGTQSGTVQFEFQAFDRQGHESNVIVKELTVN